MLDKIESYMNNLTQWCKLTLDFKMPLSLLATSEISHRKVPQANIVPNRRKQIARSREEGG